MARKQNLSGIIYAYRGHIDKAAEDAAEALKITPVKNRKRLAKQLESYMIIMSKSISSGRSEARPPVGEMLKEVFND